LGSGELTRLEDSEGLLVDLGLVHREVHDAVGDDAVDGIVSDGEVLDLPQFLSMWRIQSCIKMNMKSYLSPALSLVKINTTPYSER